jgi:pyrroloquinoline quinone biosynthesis protein E
MKEPCASCPRREQDFGGCRCQAFALTGDARATDPVCHLAPDHARVVDLAAVRSDVPYVYRRMEPTGGKRRPAVRSREGQTVS